MSAPCNIARMTTVVYKFNFTRSLHLRDVLHLFHDAPLSSRIDNIYIYIYMIIMTAISSAIYLICIGLSHSRFLSNMISTNGCFGRYSIIPQSYHTLPLFYLYIILTSLHYCPGRIMESTTGYTLTPCVGYFTYFPWHRHQIDGINGF